MTDQVPEPLDNNNDNNESSDDAENSITTMDEQPYVINRERIGRGGHEVQLSNGMRYIYDNFHSMSFNGNSLKRFLICINELRCLLKPPLLISLSHNSHLHLLFFAFSVISFLFFSYRSLLYFFCFNEIFSLLFS